VADPDPFDVTRRWPAGSEAGPDRSDPLADLPRPVAYVLSGGGPLGAIQVGMLQALAERPIQPDLIVGASAGAINGAILAQDPRGAATRLGHIWAGLDRREVFPGHLLRHLLTLRRHRSHLYPATGLEEILERHAHTRRIEDLAVRFVAVAVDAANGEPVLLDHGPLGPALRASSAIPAVFPPVEIDGRLLYDGGIAGNVPLRWALELGAASVVVLDCRLSQRPTRVPETVGQALLFGLAVIVGRQAHDELEHAAQQVPVVYLPGPPGTQQSIFDFSRTPELIESAYTECRDFFDGLKIDGPGLYGDPQAARVGGRGGHGGARRPGRGGRRLGTAR